MIVGSYFELGELVGEGGMGSVYRGLDTRTGQRVAIKRLKPDLVTATDSLARFANEAEALRRLNHPNIVKVLATFEEGSQHYLVMEFVGGGSLLDLLKNTPQLPVARVLEIALDLSDALIRAHRLNIIHRDLKPANVLLAEDGIPRLTDFGIARIGTSPHLTETGVTIGTLDYLSPEALNGELVDARADIWAFGVMLYEMLVAQRPFQGNTPSQVLTAILIHPTPDLEIQRPDVPVALVDVVYRMLEKDRGQRIPSVRQVGAELEAILQGYDTQPARAANREHLAYKASAAITPIADRPERPKHNLPVQTTPFVGRDKELAAVAKLISDPNIRLVTVLGPGGMGKTRLALKTAARFVSPAQATARDPGNESGFSDGVYFVSLAPITAPEFIIPTIAESVQFSFYSGEDPAKQLLDYLREKNVLLVIDNFEHVIAGAIVIADILKAAPHVKTLVTTRERLNILGETLFTIGGMDIPEREAPESVLEYDSSRLFLQSARRAQPGFELSIDDLPHLVQICRLVNGMPLALELAAAWTSALQLPEIAAEIERSLDFLETEMRDMPERQRSVRAVFESSWRRLSEDERAVFSKLSVFRDGFTRDAAIVVAGASLRSLTGLVNKSLLMRDKNGRYQIHELLRQYAEEALEQSGVADPIHEAHADYYATLVDSLFPTMAVIDDTRALKQVGDEIENMRVAYHWAIKHRSVRLLHKLTFGLHLFYQSRSLYLEAAEVFGKTVECLDQLPLTKEVNEALIEALLGVGWILIRLGEIEKSKVALERGYTLVKTTPTAIGHHDPISPLGLIYSIMGDYETAIRYGQEGLTYNLARNDHLSATFSYYTLTSAAFGQGDYLTARRYSQQALITAEKQMRWFAAYIHVDLGNIARVLGDYEDAKRHYQACYTIRKEFSDPEGMAVSLKQLGHIALLEGDAAKAKGLYEESLTLYKNLGDRAGLATAFTGLGTALSALADYPAARRELTKALNITSSLRLTPLNLSTLIGFGDLLLRSGEVERAQELLALVRAHPSSSHESIADAEALLTKTESANPAALERGRQLELDTVVRELLGQ